VVPTEFQPFFTASVAASAGLIGLLFVSVSIAPERVFGPASEAVRQAQALSAFTALANIFFISMTSLIPRILFGIAVTAIAIPAAVQTLALLGLIPHWRKAHIVGRGLFLFVASAAIYTYELVIGIQMWRDTATIGLMISLAFVIIGAYAIGLGRAWELLGAPRVGLVSSFWRLVTGARGAKGHATKP
jgi:hypothetical protein